MDAPAPSYRDYLNALQKYSPDAGIFLLLHKMEPITDDRAALLKHWARELRAESGAVPIAVFGTTIHDETLFKVRPFDVFSHVFFSSFSPLSLSPPYCACLD